MAPAGAANLAEIHVQEGANEREQCRKLEADHPGKLRIHLIETAVNLIEAPMHIRPQVADVNVQLRDRRSVFHSSTFQVRDSLFNCRHPGLINGPTWPDSTSSW